METLKGLITLSIALWALWNAISARKAAKEAAQVIQKMSDAFDAKLRAEGIDPVAFANQVAQTRKQ